MAAPPPPKVQRPPPPPPSRWGNSTPRDSSHKAVVNDQSSADGTAAKRHPPPPKMPPRLQSRQKVELKRGNGLVGSPPPPPLPQRTRKLNPGTGRADCENSGAKPTRPFTLPGDPKKFWPKNLVQAIQSRNNQPPSERLASTMPKPTRPPKLPPLKMRTPRGRQRSSSTRATKYGRNDRGEMSNIEDFDNIIVRRASKSITHIALSPSAGAYNFMTPPAPPPSRMLSPLASPNPKSVNVTRSSSRCTVTKSAQFDQTVQSPHPRFPVHEEETKSNECEKTVTRPPPLPSIIPGPDENSDDDDLTHFINKNDESKHDSRDSVDQMPVSTRNNPPSLPLSHSSLSVTTDDKSRKKHGKSSHPEVPGVISPPRSQSTSFASIKRDMNRPESSIEEVDTERSSLRRPPKPMIIVPMRPKQTQNPEKNTVSKVKIHGSPKPHKRVPPPFTQKKKALHEQKSQDSSANQRNVESAMSSPKAVHITCTAPPESDKTEGHSKPISMSDVKEPQSNNRSSRAPKRSKLQPRTPPPPSDFSWVPEIERKMRRLHEMVKEDEVINSFPNAPLLQSGRRLGRVWFADELRTVRQRKAQLEKLMKSLDSYEKALKHKLRPPKPKSPAPTPPPSPRQSGVFAFSQEALSPDPVVPRSLQQAAELMPSLQTDSPTRPPLPPGPRTPGSGTPQNLEKTTLGGTVPESPSSRNKVDGQILKGKNVPDWSPARLLIHARNQRRNPDMLNSPRGINDARSLSPRRAKPRRFRPIKNARNFLNWARKKVAGEGKANSGKNSRWDARVRRKSSIVFTRSLEDLVVQEDVGLSIGIPRIVIYTVDTIWKRGLDVEGIFRKSGNKEKISQVARKLDSNGDIDWDNTDIHVIAGVLKKFLRNLSEPLIPYSLYDRVILLDKQKRTMEIFDYVVKSLPEIHWRTFRLIFMLLKEIARLAEENKMTERNLAIVFAPNILKKKDETTQAFIQDMKSQHRAVTSMIKNFDASNEAEEAYHKLRTAAASPSNRAYEGISFFPQSHSTKTL